MNLNNANSQTLYEEALAHFPGGVNSPVRAFTAVGGRPIFFRSAKGAYLYDVDQNQYIDYIGSWGPMIAGHTRPEVIEAVRQSSSEALSYGACSEYELRLARKIKTRMPSLEKLRFVVSGTEACMAVIRLARAYTGRPLILKFSGCYHGHYDAFLVQAGSGVATLGLPDSPGVLPELASQTLTLPYNDLAKVEDLFADRGDQIAAIILEPVVGNAGCLLPEPGFLTGLRMVCDRYRSLLIFDEVMTGFRVSSGGAQELYKMKPDLTTLAKIIGGGLPVGVYGGRAEIMDWIAPAGPVYQAGTLAGNPVAMMAGLKTLELTEESGFYQSLENMGAKLEAGLKELAEKHHVPCAINRCGSMFTIFFTDLPAVKNFAQACTCDREIFAQFFRAMLEEGIYLPPSQFEAAFFSSQHQEKEISMTLEAADRAFRKLTLRK
ncbi:MAG: glutamate-1-semialdehyde 2,1-aminomutase [Candidatus Caenarcaniphilales bacterium]|nr:glutamate-1-semialdehyde 2,1-aminomutase [Candidatus Caenarcaniphilales bacterium]